MNESIILQQPTAPAQQLFLLFHGVGAHPASMAPLGHRLAAAFPNAWVVCVQAPFPGDMGSGHQWFSVQGVTETNRMSRVDEAMPLFVESVRHWQRASGVDAEATALVGFSQGAIMALESTQRSERLAGRVVALSGRFALLPQQVPQDTTLHMIHGKTDPVMHYGFTVEAAQHLVQLGADLTADVLPFLGHQINDEVADLVLERLTTHLPQRRWQEAMRAAESKQSED